MGRKGEDGGRYYAKNSETFGQKSLNDRYRQNRGRYNGNRGGYRGGRRGGYNGNNYNRRNDNRFGSLADDN